MTNNELAAAFAVASENDKAVLAQYLLDALRVSDLDDHSATKRQLVAAFDRFADEHGAKHGTR